MADDRVAIQTNPSAPSGPPVFIKTFITNDSDGKSIEIQAMALVDEAGRIVIPMREETGQKLLEILTELNNVLVKGFGGGGFLR